MPTTGLRPVILVGVQRTLSLANSMQGRVRAGYGRVDGLRADRRWFGPACPQVLAGLWKRQADGRWLFVIENPFAP